jgi:hypothetical protein
MRFFPSMPAAALAGGVVSPLCMYASRVTAERFDSALLQFAVGAAGFLFHDYGYRRL